MKLRKTHRISACTLATAMFMSTNLLANENWYVSASINQSNLDNVNTVSSQAIGNVNRRIDISTDNETGFGLSLGRTLLTQDNGNTLSVELSYNSTDFDIQNIAFMGRDFSASEGRSEGQIDLTTVLARAVYQFNLGSFKPYLGIGIGQTDFEVDGRYGMSVGRPNQIMPPFADGNDSVSAIEFRAGVEYQINNRFGVTLEYTTVDADDVRFTRRGGGPGGLANTSQSGDVSFDTISLGAKYRF